MVFFAFGGFLAAILGWSWLWVVLAAFGALLLFLGALLTLAERRWRFRFRTIYRSSARDAGGQGHTVFSHVANALRRKGEPYSDMAGLLETYVLNPMEHSLTHFRSRVETRLPRFDTRQAFIEFFRRYQLQVRWSKDAGRLCSYDWENDGNYALWKQADADFLTALKELVDRSSDAAFRKAILSESWPQGGRREYW